ncbi:MAG: hypothetical protein ABIV06_13410 [Thermoanaerobaculia bacterium]
MRDETSVIAQIGKERDLGRTTRQAFYWGAAAAALFGVTLGTYDQSWIQLATSAVKLPLLLFGSAALCFPTFHAVQVLRAPKALSLAQSVALQATALSSTAVVWASFSLPLLFLIGTTRNYKLAQALALAVGAAGGFVGLARLRAGYRKLCDPDQQRGSTRALLLYFVIHAVVGAQLAWVLRPFIGSPTLSFELFRNLDGNIFNHILGMLGS